MSRSNPVKSVLGGVLALLACYLAYCAWDDAHFIYLRSANSAAAYAARPNDALALAKMVDRKVEQGGATDNVVAGIEPRDLRAALQRAPLSRALLRILATKAALKGDQVKSNAALLLSDRVSRRDALTQLSLIERSVQDDDMRGAIRHYHAALSVHPELGSALFPILAKAIAFPEVRAALAPYLARQAPWSTGMLGTAIASGNPVDVAKLIIPVGDMVRGEAYETLNARLIARLAESGDFRTATEVAQSVVPKANLSALTTFGVSEATSDTRLGSLAWNLNNGERILVSGNDVGGFDIDMEPLSRGIIAIRTVPVVGGKTYIMSQTLRGIADTDAESTLNWQAFCLPAAERQMIWQQRLPRPRRTENYQSQVVVPATCKGLEFVLSGRGPEGQQAAHMVFEALDFKMRTN